MSDYLQYIIIIDLAFYATANNTKIQLFATSSGCDCADVSTEFLVVELLYV